MKKNVRNFLLVLLLLQTISFVTWNIGLGDFSKNHGVNDYRAFSLYRDMTETDHSITLGLGQEHELFAYLFIVIHACIAMAIFLLLPPKNDWLKFLKYVFGGILLLCNLGITGAYLNYSWNRNTITLQRTPTGSQLIVTRRGTVITSIQQTEPFILSGNDSGTRSIARISFGNQTVRIRLTSQSRRAYEEFQKKLLDKQIAVKK